MAHIIIIRPFRLHNFFVVLLCLIFLGSTPLRAAPNDPTKAEWIKAGTIAASGLALTFGLRFVSTPQCYWCSTNKFDETIGRSWALENTTAARLGSDLLAFGLVPLIGLSSVALASPHLNHALRDTLVVIASAASTAAVTEAIKVSSRRARPEAVFGLTSGTNDQDNRSFVSGHASFAFSFLTSATVLAFKRHQRWAPHVAFASAGLGVLVGYSRIAAAKHWMTDVLAGMTLGIGIGAVMPFIILAPSESSATASSFYVVPNLNRSGLEIGMLW